MPYLTAVKILLNNLDMSTLTKKGTKTKKVNVDFPEWVINSLDLEATKIGVTRQSIIKVWIVRKQNANTKKGKTIVIFLPPLLANNKRLNFTT